VPFIDFKKYRKDMHYFEIISVLMDSFFVLEVLGVELRASHFLGRHYTS
jgi:hypothetical protein